MTENEQELTKELQEQTAHSQRLEHENKMLRLLAGRYRQLISEAQEAAVICEHPFLGTYAVEMDVDWLANVATLDEQADRLDVKKAEM